MRGQITHIIFDVDGLLLDTETMYSEATQAIVDEYGKIYTWEIKQKIMGMPALQASTKLISELELPMTPAELMTRLSVKVKQLFPFCNLKPGAEKLIKHLHEHNIPMAIASGSTEEHFLLKKQKHGHLFDLIPLLTFGSDPQVKKGKPDPDIYLIAACKFGDEKRLDTDNSHILVFEDAPNGVESALAAKMRVVMVPDKRINISNITQPDQILDTLEDFRPHEWGLPPFA